MSKENVNKKAVVLVSGGLDSTTTLAIVKSENYDIYAISYDYGQRHKFELEAASNICRFFKVQKHVIFKLDLRGFGGSALTDDISVPHNRNEKDISSGVIPVTYVPARNTIFLSIALAWAETLNANDIFIGVNALDYSGYPDCRPMYIESFEKTANLGTKKGISGNGFKIHTPLIDLTKGEIIQKGISLDVDYQMTCSCYSPSQDGIACGDCDACLLRKKGFESAGLKDPVPYII